jgi:hypothetical protein
MDAMMHIIIPLSVYYMLKVYIRGPKIWVSAAFVGLSQRQTRKKKKQTMLLYCLQEVPIADFIVLPSRLRTEMCEDSTL